METTAPPSTLPVCGIDPGIVNMSYWIGRLAADSNAVETLVLRREAIGAAREEVGEGGVGGTGSNGAGTETAKKSKKKPSVQSATAISARFVADQCLQHGAEFVIVETAPQWNVPIRISAATMYGVMCARRDPDKVRFSSPTTKLNAIKHFASALGVNIELPPDGLDKLNKKSSAMIRVINKRNAVKVVTELLKRSNDAVGLDAFMSSPDKQDDMADALLLGCGMALSMRKEEEKMQKREERKKRREDSKRSVGAGHHHGDEASSLIPAK